MHDLIKQFKMMQKMMQKMGKGGLAGAFAGGMPDPSQLEGLGGLPGAAPGRRGKGRRGGGNSAFQDFMRGRRR